MSEFVFPVRIMGTGEKPERSAAPSLTPGNVEERYGQTGHKTARALGARQPRFKNWNDLKLAAPRSERGENYAFRDVFRHSRPSLRNGGLPSGWSG